jgi:hypothetical protein
MHDKRCLAAAIIAAVENMRDAEGSDVDFRIAVQNNYMLQEADAYLHDHVADCICGYRKANAFADDLRRMAEEFADKYPDSDYPEELRQRAFRAEANRSVE